MSDRGPQYEQDLAAMKKKLSEIAEARWSMLTGFVRASKEGNGQHIRNCGHKDLLSALVYTVESYNKDTEKTIVAFERKYP